MRSHTFFIEVEPYPWKVVAIGRGKSWASAKTHSRTLKYQKRVSDRLILNRPATPYTGPVALILTFFMPRPKYLKDKPAVHTKKPDLTNLVKAIEDSLVKAAWIKDDCQVISTQAIKRYVEPGAECGTIVDINFLTMEEALGL